MGVMQKKGAKKHIRYMTKLRIIIVCLILASLFALGFIMNNRFQHALKTIIEDRMLDVSSAAAAMLDGDVLRELQPGDEGTPEYNQIYATLTAFLNNIELDYIYTVRDMGDGSFTFIIDSDPNDPGQFGEPIVRTDALVAASRGTPSVDRQPYTDNWGRFYSAYSPVFDSQGKVVGIVAVDFSTQWYDEQVKQNTRVILVCSILFSLISVIIFSIISVRLNKRIYALAYEIGELENDVDSLNGLIHLDEVDNEEDSTETADSKAAEKAAAIAVNENIEGAREQVSYMRKEIGDYKAYVRKRSLLDSLTGVGNKRAYLEMMRQLDIQIKERTADFVVFAFDINGLKSINDRFGYGQGDRIILNAAKVLQKAFGEKCVYRIGGDEFIAIRQDISEEDVKTLYKVMDQKIDELNADELSEYILSIARGMARYTPNEDEDYNAVFRRANAVAYRNKAEYYTKNRGKLVH